MTDQNFPPEVFELKDKLAQLEESLLNTLPNMPTLLRDIHKQLKSDPNIVTMLSDEDCATIVKGLKHQTKVNITEAIIAKKPKKALKNMTVDDL